MPVPTPSEVRIDEPVELVVTVPSAAVEVVVATVAPDAVVEAAVLDVAEVLVIPFRTAICAPV